MSELLVNKPMVKGVGVGMKLRNIIEASEEAS